MPFDALKVGELARRTGLTVRTLHHYDEIGLLRPSLHTDTGHRLYTAGDVARLQQVVSLRQLGFSLEEIRACLDRPGFSPLEVIQRHVARLREQIELEQRLCERLEGLARYFSSTGEVSADEFLRTIEVMTMWEKAYTPEQYKRDLDPASPEAQALTRRWDELHERTVRCYEGYPEIKQAIADNYKKGVFEGYTLAPQAADRAFIERVKAARAASGKPTGDATSDKL
jgi:DNA-binding transcriptional MerR regulator